jgi:2-methylcitrate dehydratase PrpD
MPTAAQRIARFANRLGHGAIPGQVRAVARNCLIDTLGVALAGAAHPAAAGVRHLAQAVYRPGAATVLGLADGLAAPGAALANGTAAHALDFDDNSYAGFVHPSAVIVPAALAAAEVAEATGADLLTAFVAGAEAELCVGAATASLLYQKGWWTTGVLGPVGSAVAASWLLCRSEDAIGHALGIAVAGTGGAKACFGTDGKPALCGRAAEAGVVAALMAQAGLTGPAEVLEDRRGFARLFNDGVLDPAAFDALGRRWYLVEPGIDVKRIPICLSAHAAVDAVMDLLAEHGLGARDVARVTCDVGPVVRTNLVHADPRTPQEAQFSLPFAIACVLVHGDVGLAHLDPAALRDERIREAMQGVAMVTTSRWDDPAMARSSPEGAHVALETRDGRRFERFRGMARGTTAHPLTEEEIAAKFLACASPMIGAADAERLLADLRAVESLPSVRRLVSSAGRHGSASGRRDTKVMHRSSPP